MADDYRRVMDGRGDAAGARGASGLPSHFTDDYSALVRRIEEEMGVESDRSGTGCGSGLEQRAGGGHAPIDFGHRLANLRAAPLVPGGRELTLEFRACEPQRLELPEGFRVAHVAHLCLGALALELFHPFLNSRIRVDESFASVAHIFHIIR